mmetsp:Transcript_24924/g.63196  ORF Transcript_24924/g.63196 Transcript_24924/m.63196 type:complete len:83 (+) Transcript_24924:340-588(+)
MQRRAEGAVASVPVDRGAAPLFAEEGVRGEAATLSTPSVAASAPSAQSAGVAHPVAVEGVEEAPGVEDKGVKAPASLGTAAA